MRRAQRLRKERIYRAIEAENWQREAPTPLRTSPATVELRAEDRRDPIEIARAAQAALTGAST